MARFRLHTAVAINDVVHAAGSIIHQADDWIGPHRTAVASHETLEDGAIAPGRDVPLYEKLPEPKPEPEADVEAEAEEKAKALAEASLAYGVTGGI
jgi:hypothetical protein